MNAVAAQPASDPRDQPISRYELWAVVAITILGAAVRFAFPSAMAIEHFDEGVYASNLLFPDQDFRYPDRHFYAPSLVPALIEWSIMAFDDNGIAPMLPSLLFGTLTIPLIWWYYMISCACVDLSRLQRLSVTAPSREGRIAQLRQFFGLDFGAQWSGAGPAPQRPIGLRGLPQ